MQKTRIRRKKPLSGCQKRKKKRSPKLAGSETEKAKQDSAVDDSSKQVAAEPKTYFEEEKRLTLDEYEKVREEKKKSLEATTAAVRKISAEEFKGLQLLEKADEEEAVKKAERVKPKEKTQSKGGESDAKKPPSSRLSTLTTPSSASSA
jgi:hypothetical protein